MIENDFFFPRNTKIAIFLPIADLAVLFMLLPLITRLYDNSWNDLYAISDIAACLIYLFFSNYVGVYDKFLKSSIRKYWVTLFYCWSLAFLLILSLSFIRKNTADHSRFILTFWWMIGFIGLLLVHSVWHRIINHMQMKGRYEVKVAFAGNNKLAWSVINKLTDNKSRQVIFKGLYHKKELAEEKLSQQNVSLGKFDKIQSDARNGLFDILFIALPLVEEDNIRKIIKGLSDTTVSIYVIPDSFIFELMHGEMQTLRGTPVIEIFDSPFYGVNSYLKRVEDIVLTSLLMIGLLPIMAVIAVVVKLTSKGPALFKQRRYGLNGEVINIYKFRSMKVCEDGDKVRQATKNDDRITPFGAFLRRSSLDELPQFFNVLAGTLSIVGPRPHAVAHNEMYRGLIDGYMMRHKVKPGITGWAQINGYRGETAELEQMRRRVEYDINYIREWSMGKDIQIILKTIWVVISGKNAY